MTNKHSPTQAILFDLDGTLLDTAPDLIYALNRLRQEQGLTELSQSTLRPIISYGSKAMIKTILGIEETDSQFAILRERFFELYQKHLADSTQFFPHIEKVLSYIEKHHIPWGIVTNKLTRHTLPILKALNLEQRALCVVCGDTLSSYKPDPAPIQYACELLKQDPKHCLYVGDSMTDVIASKAAGATALVAKYGYIGADENPLHWQADGYIDKPIEIIEWIVTK